MANEQASTTVPLPAKRYVARQTISVGNCRTKFSNKEDVVASDFFSVYDPKQSVFILKLRFGSGAADYLAAYVISRDVKITVTKVNYDVFDDKGVRLVGKRDLWGFGCLVKSEVINHMVNVICEIEYERASPPSESVDAPPRSQLQDDFTKLFENASHADCAFIVQGEKIMAHKGVLATRCSYFQSNFQSRMKESISGEIEVPDFTPQVFKELLKYLYSGRRPECSVEDLMGLLAAADKYGVEELKEMCESALSVRLRSENVIEVLMLADLHNCSVLMKHATLVFKMYMGDLKKEEERWFKLKENPDLLLRLLDSFMP